MSARLLDAAGRLSGRLEALDFSSAVTHVYNPFRYARAPYAEYLRRFGSGRREVLLLGMNPGPWGMAQTGVPFGEVAHVRDWMGIEAPVGQPDRPHPARPVTGFACPRNEVSGARLWGWARERFGPPERFFARFFVVNYCPLLFLKAPDDKRATNVTPDKLPRALRLEVEAACDEHLATVIDAIQPSWLVGVGGFAESCLLRLRETHEFEGQVGRILHPSPASPAANRGWAGQAEAMLTDMGIERHGH